MKGSKALKRAAGTSEGVSRFLAKIPLITDTTELVTPARAEELLKQNSNNRPINWHTVEKYSEVMKAGKWKLHAQGIILDENGNILTGQTRLWAVVYSDTAVHLRISRGNPSDTAKLLDRGRPQSSRDLASRDTQRKHPPIECSIARAVCALCGNLRPSVDAVADAITANATKAEAVLAETKGTKKTKSVLMVLATICHLSKDASAVKDLAKHTEVFAVRLDALLQPETAEGSWGRGAAFSLALEHAKSVVAPKVAPR